MVAVPNFANPQISLILRGGYPDFTDENQKASSNAFWTGIAG